MSKAILGMGGGTAPSFNMYAIKKKGAAMDSNNMKRAIQTPTPRVLTVARANSRYASSTELGGFERTGGYGSIEGSSFGPGRSCFQPGAGLSSKGVVNTIGVVPVGGGETCVQPLACRAGSRQPTGRHTVDDDLRWSPWEKQANGHAKCAIGCGLKAVHQGEFCIGIVNVAIRPVGHRQGRRFNVVPAGVGQ